MSKIKSGLTKRTKKQKYGYFGRSIPLCHNLKKAPLLDATNDAAVPLPYVLHERRGCLGLYIVLIGVAQGATSCEIIDAASHSPNSEGRSTHHC